MVTVEIYDADDVLILTASLPFMPRTGEYLSLDACGYFKYYKVSEVWIRQSGENEFVACLSVEIDE